MRWLAGCAAVPPGRRESSRYAGGGWGVRGWRGDLAVQPVIAPDDPVVRRALCSRVKYARVVRRRVRRRTRWYVQLVCDGHPYRKPKDRMGNGSVGLDLGPSTLAAVSAKEAMLVPAGLRRPARAWNRSCVRHTSRAGRTTNPRGDRVGRMQQGCLRHAHGGRCSKRRLRARRLTPTFRGA